MKKKLKEKDKTQNGKEREGKERASHRGSYARLLPDKIPERDKKT